MVELTQMATELELYLAKKEQVLKNALDPYTLGKIQNIKTKIVFFKQMLSKVSKDITLKKTIVSNFSKSKEEIIKDIDNIEIA